MSLRATFARVAARPGVQRTCWAVLRWAVPDRFMVPFDH
jgi:hypothetical protein